MVTPECARREESATEQTERYLSPTRAENNIFAVCLTSVDQIVFIGGSEAITPRAIAFGSWNDREPGKKIGVDCCFGNPCDTRKCRILEETQATIEPGRCFRPPWQSVPIP